MKNPGIKLMCNYLILTAILFAGINNLYAQDEKEKVKPKLRMNYFKYMDGKVELKANAYYKKDGEKTYCSGATVGFYTDEDFKNEYSKVLVDDNGIATLELVTEDLKAFADSSNRNNFYARLEENELFKEKEADITILDADLSIEFLTEDSVNYLKASLMCFDPDSAKMLPANRVALKSFVERSLCLFPVGGDFNYTDENGEIMIQFPDDLFGNENGMLTVVVKVDEDDDYGTVEAKSVIDWGLPYTDYVHHTKALLIGDSSKAPLVMLVGILGILILIWGFLTYIIINILRIKKLGKKVA